MPELLVAMPLLQSAEHFRGVSLLCLAAALVAPSWLALPMLRPSMHRSADATRGLDSLSQCSSMYCFAPPSLVPSIALPFRAGSSHRQAELRRCLAPKHRALLCRRKRKAEVEG
jgi:hypothetical protein